MALSESLSPTIVIISIIIRWRFEVFSSQGRQVAPMAVKFGVFAYKRSTGAYVIIRVYEWFGLKFGGFA